MSFLVSSSGVIRRIRFGEVEQLTQSVLLRRYLITCFYNLMVVSFVKIVKCIVIETAVESERRMGCVCYEARV